MNSNTWTTWSIITVLLTIVWFLLGYNWFVCGDCSKSGPVTNTTSGISDQANLPPVGPLMFNWSDPEPVLGDEFAAFKDSILANYNGKDTLVITGHYFASEENTSSYPNMGIARAEKIKALLADVIDPSKIKVNGKMVEVMPGARDHPFQSAAFDFKPVIVEELANSATIYFPYKSTQKEADDQIDAYLNKLAAIIKEGNSTVSLTGHTDNVGGSNYNYNLGMQRAQAIRDILISKGVPSAKIKTSSKGDTEPASSNANESGRKLNRRVFIQLN